MRKAVIVASISTLSLGGAFAIAEETRPGTDAETVEPTEIEARATTQSDGIVIKDGGGIALRDAGKPTLNPTSNRLQWAHPQYAETTELYYQNPSSFNFDLRSAGTRALRVTNSSTGIANLVLDEGNLGIGTSAPEARLHVNGPVRGSDASAGALEIETATGIVQVGSKNPNWAHFYTDRPRYYFDKELRINSGRIGSYDEDLKLAAAGSIGFTLRKSNGNVGIGTSSPAAKLDVGGDIAVNGQPIVDGSGQWVGSPIPRRITSVYCVSAFSVGSCEDACDALEPGHSVISGRSFNGVGTCSASVGGDSCQAEVTLDDEPSWKGLCCSCEAIR